MSWAKIYTKYHKFSGSWAFLGHRLSGLALIGYLFMHILTLRGLQQHIPGVPPGVHPWTAIAEHYSHGPWLFGEWFLFAAVLYHAFNGIRIAIVDLGHGSKYQKQLFWGFIALGVVLFLAMGWLMFRHVMFGA